MTLPSDEKRLFSAEWGRLQEQGEAPELKGRSAEQDERDKERKRRMMPCERRRQGRKITPTLSAELVAELRQICQELGHVDQEGQGVIASAVIEWFLGLAVEAYRQGLIESYQELVPERRFRLRLPGSGGGK